MLEDLVLSAVNEALKTRRRNLNKMGKLTGGLNIQNCLIDNGLLKNSLL